ncbi:MAG TPA: type I DNA topoisomerase [Bacteroidales bacterium]|nr:type I DNA topoisomerase [Bacteroidales bacterium]HRX96190.1 type I DNA topoisomerase [Bacteroidales bacterium]
MGKNLVIVESPAKAKTIERFLGKEYSVLSSYGHVRDLSKKDLSVDIDKGFVPNYEIPADKKKTIKELQSAAKGAEVVWLATDEDREGEAISWHLLEVLKLDENKTKRIVFHEITKNAIVEAIENPRKLDKHLVDAQQARRVLDRLVGYELSPVLWKKVKPALSAGRVQSVAVRLIVEREEEIKNFVAESAYRVIANFILPGNEKIILQAELDKRFKTSDEAKHFLTDCIDAGFVISDVEKKPAKKSPAPPFTTSTLQQEASRKLGFSVAKTMLVAQQLYESGKITYMRTDSVNLSKLALSMAKTEIEKSYGKEYVNTRQFTTKSKSAQEAHEAIRPTYLNESEIDGDNSQQRLYELIWKRTIASQMADAQLEKTNVNIDISNRKEQFVARGEVIKFDGFLKVYLESTDDEDQEAQKGMLPPVHKGDKLTRSEITATEKYSQPPSRYTEASLVKKMEDLGIGRPSTYAPTISTIQKREYVVKEDREGEDREITILKLSNGAVDLQKKMEKTRFEKSKLFPTDIGTVVNNFLVEYFDNILDFNFTANVEKEFDEIANGNKVWNEMIKEFYGPFHDRVEDTLEKSKKQSGERLLGTDPQSGKSVFAKIGRYGPIVQIGDSQDEEKPRFAGMIKDQSIETITLEEALDLFKLPRNVGAYENEEIVAAIGRFGPYVRHAGKFYSLTKTDDPLTVSEERAIELIEAKRQKDREKTIKIFNEDESVQVLKGRYGAYISKGKNNYRIPKGKDPASLTYNDCVEIIEATDKKPKGRKK